MFKELKSKDIGLSNTESFGKKVKPEFFDKMPFDSKNNLDIKNGTNGKYNDFNKGPHQTNNDLSTKNQNGMKWEGNLTEGKSHMFSAKNELHYKRNEIESMKNHYSDLNTMKKDLGKTYSEIKENKPQNSPNIAKWFENGGTIKIDEVEGKQTWIYRDSIGREVSYIEGYPVFPPEAKHPVIGDIDIGKFTGDRNIDKKHYLAKLKEQFGLTEIPDGYDLHHDCKNGNMQLVKREWHKEFTHAGGHCLFMEG